MANEIKGINKIYDTSNNVFLQSVAGEWRDASGTRFSVETHDHDSAYAAAGHDHDSAYAALGHTHNSDYATLGHNHDAITVTGTTFTITFPNGTVITFSDDGTMTPTTTP